MYETDSWPFIPARDFRKVPPGRKVNKIVIHDMEAPERADTAENIARYFQRPDRPSSAHICVDSDSIVQSVRDSHIAFAAPGANHDGIQIELAGYANQKMRDWLDQYGVPLLANAAYATAQYCLKYDLPIRKLSAREVKAGERGICGHADVTEAYRESNHTDPGKDFPWDFFISLVRVYRDMRLALVVSAPQLVPKRKIYRRPATKKKAGKRLPRQKWASHGSRQSQGRSRKTSGRGVGRGAR